MGCPNSRSSQSLQLGLLAGLGAFVLLVACLVGGAAAGIEGCAGGPTTSDGTTRGTPCPDLIVTRPGVDAIYSGGGADTIYARPGVSVRAGGGDDTIYAAPAGVTVNGGEGADVISAQPRRSIDAARVASRSTAITSPNLVANPSFETDLSGWAQHGSSGHLFDTYARQSGWASDGSWSLRVTETALPVGEQRYVEQTWNQVPTSPGERLTLSVDLNVLTAPANGVALKVYIQFYNSSGGALSWKEATVSDGTGLKTATVTADAPANAAFAAAGPVWMDGAYTHPTGVSSADLYVDDVTLTRDVSDSCPTGCYLSPGDDQFNGGPGPDTVYGGRSNDTLDGGGGDDRLYGGLGDDTVRGGDANDLLSGGWGADSIDGQAGNDYVRGDGTPDTTIQDSGGGNDTLSYATGVTPGFGDGAGYPSFSSYPNFPAADAERGVYLNLGTNVADDGFARYGGGVDTLSATGFETVIGTAFSDDIVGSDRNETIYGGGGGDVLLGSGGNDVLYGGADGDHLDGGTGTNSLNGNAGSDYCHSPDRACERWRSSETGVRLRNPSQISVGFMAPEAAGRSQLYLAGSSGADSISATYVPGSPPRVTFTVLSGSAGFFNRDSSAGSGCSIPTSTQATCTLTKPLDSIVLAGVGGADVLQANGFPATVSVINLGGEGADTLTGSDLSEDVLVDGPDFTGAGADRLNGLGGDDALINNNGQDHLLAGNGNDLMLSIFACGGDELNGGGGRDNASWARATTGVEARIVEGVAGQPGDGNGPQCGSAPLSTIAEVEDLEGTSFADRLYGGPGANQLLGRAGGDSFYGAEGSDLLLTNAGDLDPVISCGADPDTAVIDHPLYGESVDPDCESLSEADPKYAG
jgi:Ca2+-binding RTX toxin-like protein